jgi:hypothetical protein
VARQLKKKIPRSLKCNPRAFGDFVGTASLLIVVGRARAQK